MLNLIPKFIAEKYENNQYSGNFHAFTLFLDVSGFTHTTETLMKKGKEGAEILSAILNDLYSSLTNAVYRRNGFISTYAGDAFTALFPENDPYNPIRAAEEMQNILANFKTIETDNLKFHIYAKIGIGHGKIQWKILGNKNKTFFFKGSGINNAAEAEHHCPPKNIVYHPSFLFKTGSLFRFTKTETGYYFLNSPVEQVIKPLPNVSEIKRETADIFYSVKKHKLQGEFRDIVPVFISFKDELSNQQIDELAEFLIDKSVELGGFLNGMDFGDKGGNFFVIFGAPISYENNFLRACSFAYSLKKEFQNNIRIGITCGTVYTGIIGGERRYSYTALGDTVNLAARFMMKADWGEIFVSEKLKNIISKNYYTEKKDDYKFKGKEGEIPVYLLTKEIDYMEKTPYKTEFVGRKNEVKKINEKLMELKISKRFRGIFYIYGDAGVGKSRLMYEISQKHYKEFSFFTMQADEIYRKSYAPVIEFFKRFFLQSDNNSKELNLEYFHIRFDIFLSRLENSDNKDLLEKKYFFEKQRSFFGFILGLKIQDDNFKNMEPAQRMRAAVYAGKEFFKAYALLKPIVLVIEDIHWLDNDSKDFINYLTKNIEDYPILIIPLSRFGDDGSKPNLNNDPDIETDEMVIETLPKDCIKEYAQIMIDGEVTDSLLKFINKRTAGNPFYIEQFCNYLKENNYLLKKYGKYDLISKKVDIPESIKSILIAKLDRLSDELREIVHTASVIGREFDSKILTEMLKKRNIENLLHLGESEKIWFNVTELVYIFSHALLRDAAYDMQLKVKLKMMHKFAAEIMEKIYADDKGRFAEIALHFEKAEILNKTIEYLEKAAEHSKKIFLNSDALRFYTKLISYAENQKDVLIYKNKIAEIFHFTGKWHQAENVYKVILAEAVEIDEPAITADIRKSLGELLLEKGEYLKAYYLFNSNYKFFSKEKNLIGVSNSLGNIGIAFHKMGKYENALYCFRNQMKIAQLLGNETYIGTVKTNTANVCCELGEYDTAESLYLDDISICEKNGDRYGISITAGNLGNLYSNKGYYDSALECFTKQIEIAQECGDVHGLSSGYGNIGVVYNNLGFVQDALDYFIKQEKYASEMGDEDMLSTAYGNMGLLYWQKNLLDKAELYLKKQFEIADKLGDLDSMSTAVGNLGNVYFSRGNYQKAEKCFWTQLHTSEKLGIKDSVNIAYGNLGTIFMKKNKDETSRIFYERQLQLASELEDKDSVSFALGCIGNLEKKKKNYKNAELYYNLAVDIQHDMKLKFLLCEFLLEKSDLMYLIGRVDEAEKIVQESLETAESISRAEIVEKALKLIEKNNGK